jgi:hypothetical protein
MPGHCGEIMLVFLGGTRSEFRQTSVVELERVVQKAWFNELPFRFQNRDAFLEGRSPRSRIVRCDRHAPNRSGVGEQNVARFKVRASMSLEEVRLRYLTSILVKK